jgi:hypothetical protein
MCVCVYVRACVFLNACQYLTTFFCTCASIFWVSSQHTNPKPIYYHIHKSRQVTPTLRQTNLMYTLLSYSQNLHLNITLPSTPSLKWFLYVSRHFERTYQLRQTKKVHNTPLLPHVYIFFRTVCDITIQYRLPCYSISRLAVFLRLGTGSVQVCYLQHKYPLPVPDT